MAPIDYKAILEQAFAEYGSMILERQGLDLEIAKKKQFIRATMNMLPDEEREKFNTAFEVVSGESLGLTDAIRKVLQSNPKKPFTATEVRDQLQKSKFDFSAYRSNPLASIHAVLKRLKSEEVESTEIDGVSAWRWIGEIRKTTSNAAFYGENAVRLHDLLGVYFDPKKQKEAAAIRTLGRWKAKKDE